MFLVSDIKAEVAQAIGKCEEDNADIYLAITRAVKILGNKRLIDPLKGYLNVTLPTGAFHVALPREVKKVIRLNINTNPSFMRGRLFEFAINSEGSAEGEQLGWQWSDRGERPVQFPDTLATPATLKYWASNTLDQDNNPTKTITITGYDANDVLQTEVLTIHSTAPVVGTIAFKTIESVVRSATLYFATLKTTAGATVAVYQPAEIAPSYAFIRISKAAAALHILFRKNTFTITSDEDIIPCDSEMAIIHAARAVKCYANNEYEKGEMALTKATEFLNEEQDSREEGEMFGSQMDQPGVINADMYVADGIIVRDLYDDACEVFGNIGRDKILDHIQIATEILNNKSHWDPNLGVVDILAAGDSTWEPPSYPTISLTETDAQASGSTKVGHQAIADGAEYVDVVFVDAFESGLTPTPSPTIEKTDDNDPDISVTGVAQVSETGFRVLFSAAIPSANYILHWSASA